MRRLTLILAVIAATAMLAAPALAAKGGGKGGGGASTAEGHLSVPDAAYGESVKADANPGGTDVYVYVRCWTLDGTFVYAAYFPVVDGSALIGPLRATTWPNAAATCTAEEGYFTRSGFGRWEKLATDDFKVSST